MRAKLVKPGGRLVYPTCSIHTQDNHCFILTLALSPCEGEVVY